MRGKGWGSWCLPLLTVLFLSFCDVVFICGSASLFHVWSPPCGLVFVGFAALNLPLAREFRAKEMDRDPTDFAAIRSKYQEVVRKHWRARGLPRGFLNWHLAVSIWLSRSISAGWLGMLLLGGLYTLGHRPWRALDFWILMTALEMSGKIWEPFAKGKMAILAMRKPDQATYMKNVIKRFDPSWYPEAYSPFRERAK